MWKVRLLAIAIFLAGAGIGYFNYASEGALYRGKEVPGAALFSKYPFKLGLDLSGGVHLVYKADLSKGCPKRFQRCHGGPPRCHRKAR